MIYWEGEYTYGLWIADNEEFNGFRSKLMEIMAYVKQNSWKQQTLGISNAQTIASIVVCFVMLLCYCNTYSLFQI